MPSHQRRRRDGVRRLRRGKPKFEGFSLSITPKNEAEADRLFAALADGGEVRMPLGKTFFAKRFGMVADRFGVGWMIMVEFLRRRIRSCRRGGGLPAASAGNHRAARPRVL